MKNYKLTQTHTHERERERERERESEWVRVWASKRAYKTQPMCFIYGLNHGVLGAILQ